jgi:hypothetical protein
MSECANPGHEGAGTSCAACLASLNAEVTRLRDQQARRITHERELERDTRAAIRRSFIETDLRPMAAAFLRGRYDGARDLVHETLYRASQIDPGMGRTAEARARLTQLQSTAAWALRDHGEEAKAWRGRNREQEAWDTAPMVAEAARLRAYITERGQAMHALVDGARHLTDETGRCRCPGCELIRGMDDVPVPHGHEHSHAGVTHAHPHGHENHGGTGNHDHAHAS